MRRVLVWCMIGIVVMFIILFSYDWVATAQSTGMIKGKVADSDNVPLGNVVVTAYVNDMFMFDAGTATTDHTGAYTITNLYAGVYYIRFNDYPYLPGYPTVSYKNALSADQTTPITLTAGATINNINGQLTSFGARIRGQVTDLQGKPLANIRVVPLGGNSSSSTFYDTGVDGLYNLGGLQAGTYNIVFEDKRQPPVYRKGYYNNANDLAQATVVRIVAEQTITNINSKLNRLGFITGTVTNAQNAPIFGIQVTAQQYGFGPSGMHWLDAQHARTDMNGNYVLGGLYEGAYRVRFYDTENARYNTEYYSNVFDPAAATPLTVTLNATSTNINAQLTLRGGITGRITNKLGEPLQNVEIAAEYQVVNLAENSWRTAKTTLSNENGEYALCCLDQSEYRLRFVDMQGRYLHEYYNNILFDYFSPAAAVNMVQVTAAMTTTAINAELSKPSTIISIVTDEQNHPIDDLHATFYRYNPSESGGWYQYNPHHIQPKRINDSYQMAVRSGRYRVFFEDEYLPQYISEFYDNAADLMTATDITVTEESTVTITLSLAAKAQITGKVTDLHGDPLPEITVTAYHLINLPGPVWVQAINTMTNQNGEYRLSGLDPDRYRIGFVDSSYRHRFVTEYYQDSTTVEAATDIAVSTGQAVSNINAELEERGQILGQVIDPQGMPLAYILVGFYRYGDRGNNQFDWLYASGTQTEANGVYNSHGLEPGLYRIVFQDMQYIYPREYYNNAGYLENATTITVTDNTIITGTNVQMPAASFLWPPFAQDDEILIKKGETVSTTTTGSNILTNDRSYTNGPLRAAVATLPTHGVLSLNPDGTFSYTHNGDDATSDFFTYITNDGTQQSNVTRVAITIQPVNDPPVAGNDSATVERGQRVTTLDSGAKSLLANDSDPDSSVLTATLKTGPAHGSVTINANGAFTYTHDGSAGSSDSFTYQATDNLGSSAVATVTVAVNPFAFSKTVGLAGIKPLCTPVDEIHAPVGTTIVYCYTLRNLGDAPLTSHSLVDSHLGQLLTNHVHAVAPGTAFSVTFTQTLTISTTNIATWTVTSSAEQALAAPTTNIARTAATVRIAGPTDDSDGDTIPDNQEKAGDNDGDNVPNFLDTDADGDGKLDKEEVGSNPAQPMDSDQDGIPDYLDSQSGTLKLQLFLPVIQR